MSIDIAGLARVRAQRPEAVAEAAARRVRRPLLGPGGRLLIIAADHPARGVLAAGGRPLAMADRAGLLDRLCRALARPGVDGVLATADILDDLLLLGALDGKVVMGSMNRGGLAGAAFELDDRFTGHRPEDLARLRFDAGKLLLRVDDQDPGSLTTMVSAARAIDAMAERRLPVFVEPFIARRVGGKVVNDLSAAAVTRSVAVASGLAGTSAYTWLKLPVTDDPGDMAAVLGASTLPTVLLGGDSGRTAREQRDVYDRWRAALRLPTVQGLVAGRSLLYPAEGGVESAVDTAVALLHAAERPGAGKTHPVTAEPATPGPAAEPTGATPPAAPPTRAPDPSTTTDGALPFHLPAGRAARGPYDVDIDPPRAGWGYSSLRVLTLPPGGSHAFATGDSEWIVLPLSGGCTVHTGEHRFALHGRADVFSGVTDFAYLPRDGQARITSDGGGRFALTGARCRRVLPARYGPASAVPVELRGAGGCSRQVNNFAAADTFVCDRLIAVEVLTPGGNWSSYPPHKHDECLPGEESELEEVYYFEVAAAHGSPGLAYQRVSPSGQPGERKDPSARRRTREHVYRGTDVLAEVRTGDTVLIPDGWHGPSIAAPGHDLYYLNVMAGPGADRQWLIRDHPDHAWIRADWPDQRVDPRLPLYTAPPAGTAPAAPTEAPAPPAHPGDAR